MKPSDDARIEHYRRFGRPDWRRWLRPDWERRVNPAEREAMRKDFALRDRAFETPMARRRREENEAREREEQAALEAENQREIEHEALKAKAELASLRFELMMDELRRKAWQAECAERKRRADVAWERFKAAFMRGDFAPRQKASLNPSQPRVPSGNPDGGQWTEAGSTGDGRTQGTVDHSETKPDPDLHLVQGTSDRLLNRHILQEHVGKTDEELKSRIRAGQIRTLFATRVMDRNGSFDSTESARDFISQTIANNPSDLAQVASGQLDGKFLTWRFGYQTGRKRFWIRPILKSACGRPTRSAC